MLISSRSFYLEPRWWSVKWRWEQFDMRKTCGKWRKTFKEFFFIDFPCNFSPRFCIHFVECFFELLTGFINHSILATKETSILRISNKNGEKKSLSTDNIFLEGTKMRNWTESEGKSILFRQGNTEKNTWTFSRSSQIEIPLSNSQQKKWIFIRKRETPTRLEGIRKKKVIWH